MSGGKKIKKTDEDVKRKRWIRMIELIITMLFLIVFYRLTVELDRDIFEENE